MAKSKKAPKVERAPSVKVDKAAMYNITGIYNPKAAHNVISYDNIMAVVPCTYAELALAMKGDSHEDFIGYLVRRGGLVAE